MQFISKHLSALRARYGRQNVTIGIITVCLVIALILYKLIGTGSEELTPIVSTGKEVSVATVAALEGTGSTLSLLGTVEAVREARLLTEASGRVTGVSVKLGDTVSAGTVIATIENNSERALVLQAEGVYEAAKAGASASNAGSASADRAYTEALTQAVNSYRSAFGTTDAVLRNTVDQVFAQPDTRTPGLKIDGKGQATLIGAERVELETLFDGWALDVNTLQSTDAAALISDAEENTTRLSVFVGTLAKLLTDDEAVGNDTSLDLQDLRDDFASARATLNGVLQSLSGARSALIAAQSQKEQAEIAASRGDVSLADAQVKQALGSLRLAQANLEKTIVRTPISGTVDALTVKEGTSVGIGAPAAVISSTGGLEVVAYINESDVRLITVGDEVLIHDTVQGVITEIASAIDERTKKIELRVGVKEDADKLTNGQAVTVALTNASAETNTPERDIRLPIVSIKMTPDGPIVFTVNDTRTLVPHAVVLGAIIGESVVIEEGVTRDMTIVTDARGLRAGETVVIK